MPTVINPAIFRAYDIRGTADPLPDKPTPDLTPETAGLIGRATGIYLARTYGARNMIVGRDNRLHSEKLQQAFIEGVLESGLDVLDAGLSTSPMIYFASCHYGADSAVNITASHNPKHDNGIKIVRQNAHSVADRELQEILKIIQTELTAGAAAPTSSTSPDHQSATPNHVNTNAVSATAPARARLQPLTTLSHDYLQKITATTTPAGLRGRPLKIVIDAGNGVAGAFAPAVLRALRCADGSPACEVIELYCELDGNFPNHEANPEHAKNMADLGRKVRESGADLGIGFDGDGDRLGIVDERGQHYPAEYPIMLIARELLRASPGEKIIHDVKVNQALIDDIRAHGGQPVISRVGHSFIERRLAAEDATLGGEKSGHLFFGRRHFNYYGFDDAIFAAAKVVEALSRDTRGFSEIFADLPQRAGIPELKIPCPDQLKATVVEEVSNHFLKIISENRRHAGLEDNSPAAIAAPNTSRPHAAAPTTTTHAEVRAHTATATPPLNIPTDCITLDGIRLQFPDGAWLLVRYSNTSPALTLHAEAPTPSRLDEIKELAFGQLRSFPELSIP